LFVHLSPQTPRWRSIMSTFGVRMLVRFGEQAAFIGDNFIQELRSHETDGEIVQPTRGSMWLMAPSAVSSGRSSK
jgi:transcriptional antiterminator RfaH